MDWARGEAEHPDAWGPCALGWRTWAVIMLDSLPSCYSNWSPPGEEREERVKIGEEAWILSLIWEATGNQDPRLFPGSGGVVRAYCGPGSTSCPLMLAPEDSGTKQGSPWRGLGRQLQLSPPHHRDMKRIQSEASWLSCVFQGSIKCKPSPLQVRHCYVSPPSFTAATNQKGAF